MPWTIGHVYDDPSNVCLAPSLPIVRTISPREFRLHKDPENKNNGLMSVGTSAKE